MTSDLEALGRELEQAAAQLRSGSVRGEEAAALVERCAELAAQVSAALDERARASAELPFGEAPEQERLL